MSRAELIRRLLDRLAGGDDDLAGDLAAIDDSFGALGRDDTVGRTTDERAAHLDRMWHLNG